MPVLRLTHCADQDEPQPLAPSAGNSSCGEDSSSALQEIDALSAILATAQSGIEQVQGHLARLAELADPRGLTDDQWRASQSERQTAIHREIQAIDELATTTQADGENLLDGTWSVALADPRVGGVRALRIVSMASECLGRARIGGFLSSLASTAARPTGFSEPARSRAVIRCAMLQVAAAHEQVSAFLRDALEPLRLSLEVVSANVEAAQSTFDDMDLAHQASRLTRLDALLNACPKAIQPESAQSFSSPDFTGAAPSQPGV